jgi:hypothetical protein
MITYLKLDKNYIFLKNAKIIDIQKEPSTPNPTNPEYTNPPNHPSIVQHFLPQTSTSIPLTFHLFTPNKNKIQPSTIN